MSESDRQSEQEAGESEAEEDLEEQIKQLEQHIQQNPYDFAAYAQMIELQRAEGNLEETRSYR